MGRKTKTGLDYFPFEVDFFQDIKIRKLIKRQGGKAVTVYALLLCFIYRNGYYIQWDEELPFIISEQTGFEEEYILEVIKSCVSLGLFSDTMFEEGVLTSKGIQERYQDVCCSLKRTTRIREHDLLSNSGNNRFSSEEIVISSEEIGVSSEEMPKNSVKSTQKKIKEKEKENTPYGVQKKKQDTGASCSVNADIFPSKEGHVSPPPTPSRKEPDIDRIVSLFNERFSDRLTSVRSVTERRRKAILARISEYGEESIQQVFDMVGRSPFLLGDGRNGWRADFDWIFKESNYSKILDGVYEKKTRRNKYSNDLWKDR